MNSMEQTVRNVSFPKNTKEEIEVTKGKTNFLYFFRDFKLNEYFTFTTFGLIQESFVTTIGHMKLYGSLKIVWTYRNYIWSCKSLCLRFVNRSLPPRVSAKFQVICKRHSKIPI